MGTDPITDAKAIRKEKYYKKVTYINKIIKEELGKKLLKNK